MFIYCLVRASGKIPSIVCACSMATWLSRVIQSVQQADIKAQKECRERCKSFPGEPWQNQNVLESWLPNQKSSASVNELMQKAIQQEKKQRILKERGCSQTGKYCIQCFPVYYISFSSSCFLVETESCHLDTRRNFPLICYIKVYRGSLVVYSFFQKMFYLQNYHGHQDQLLEVSLGGLNLQTSGL